MHPDLPLLIFFQATNCNIHSLLSLKYLRKLCTSTFILSSQLITYSSLGCELPFTVINFQVLITLLFNSCFVQSNIQAPYLIIPTSHAFIPAMTFPQFNTELSNFSTLLMYSLFTFPSFHYSCWNLTATLPNTCIRQG